MDARHKHVTQLSTQVAYFLNVLHEYNLIIFTPYIGINLIEIERTLFERATSRRCVD